MKLKHLLIITFVVLSAIPLVVSLNYLKSFTINQYRDQVESKLEALSKIAKQRVLAVVERIEDNTLLVSSRTQMRDSLDAFNQTREPHHKTRIDQIIQDAFQTMDKLHYISVFDQQGELVSSTLSREPIQLRRYIGNHINIRLENMKDNLVLSASTPLYKEHTLTGYLNIGFTADFLMELVYDRTGLGSSGEWLVAKRTEDGDAVFVTPLKYDHEAAFKRTVNKAREDIPITQALLGNELIMHHAPDYMEKPVLASTRYIPGLDWGLVAKINESEIQEIIADINQTVYWTGSIIILMSVLLGIGISFYIARPLEKLRENTHRIAEGDYDLTPVNATWREANDLSKAFTDMAGSIKDLNANLNEKVKERTRELDAAYARLQEISVKDALTKLYNRRFFNERLDQEFERSKRYGSDLTVVLLDIDHFKSINDTWGHDAGDAVLVELSNFLSRMVRESDVLSRYGGEEFAVLVPTSLHAALPFLERIRSEIEQFPFQYTDRTIHITCSFGAAACDESTQTDKELLKHADIALYSAKDQGRNRVVSYR